MELTETMYDYMDYINSTVTYNPSWYFNRPSVIIGMIVILIVMVFGAFVVGKLLFSAIRITDAKADEIKARTKSKKE